MTDIIRWNANFVRQLAQSVLDRARLVRSSLTAYAPTEGGSGKARAKKAKAVSRSNGSAQMGAKAKKVGKTKRKK